MAYTGVKTRFLREDEHLVLSEARQMPFVIEASDKKDMPFLTSFLAQHASELLQDVSKYGAVLLRGFDIKTDEAFEEAIISIKGLQGISEAFMSEEGRVHVGPLKYVLFTNAVYKTGGTLYLGGFHSENYYSTDTPTYISFFRRQPSEVGGETGLINMGQVYQHLHQDLKDKLEKQAFYVCAWLLSDVAERYELPPEKVAAWCERFGLSVVGEGDKKLVLMYKPNVFEDPVTQKRALQINFFEVPGLNEALRTCFMQDYQGKTWFWHRLVWRLPTFVLKGLERIYIAFASFFYSPKAALKILRKKIQLRRAMKAAGVKNRTKVGVCFDKASVRELAQLMRKYYVSCVWQPGDLILVDNRQVVHAGMPGAGPRLIRALICNPLDMPLGSGDGVMVCHPRIHTALGETLVACKEDVGYT